MPGNKRIVIVGAGVIGLSVGISLLDSKSDLQITVLEKESQLGKHASGRNSGVLHAGFYYSPDSLKAKFCREGNFELKELCSKYEIPVMRTGKVVVARNNSENERIDTLYSRGIQNGVQLEVLDASKLKEFEPLAKTHERFLWSPSTAVSDPIAVIQAMREEFIKRGGRIELNNSVNFETKNNEIAIPNYRADIVINAAGAQADRLARKVGLASQYAMVPFMGVYRAVSIEKLPLKRLVYPVPHPINPFLGVHFTITLDGRVKIGPTAIPILGREQYSHMKGWSLPDSLQALKASLALIKGKSHDFSELIRSELPKLREVNLINESSTLVSSAKDVRGWTKRPPGIRSQLVNLNNGKLEQDFIVEVSSNSVHILNAVSPGWTSAIPFGKWVAQDKVLKLL